MVTTRIHRFSTGKIWSLVQPRYYLGCGSGQAEAILKRWHRPLNTIDANISITSWNSIKLKFRYLSIEEMFPKLSFFGLAFHHLAAFSLFSRKICHLTVTNSHKQNQKHYPRHILHCCCCTCISRHLPSLDHSVMQHCYNNQLRWGSIICSGKGITWYEKWVELVRVQVS